MQNPFFTVVFFPLKEDELYNQVQVIQLITLWLQTGFIVEDERICLGVFISSPHLCPFQFASLGTT